MLWFLGCQYYKTNIYTAQLLFLFYTKTRTALPVPHLLNLLAAEEICRIIATPRGEELLFNQVYTVFFLIIFLYRQLPFGELIKLSSLVILWEGFRTKVCFLREHLGWGLPRASGAARRRKVGKLQFKSSSFPSLWKKVCKLNSSWFD